ncbi:MAG: pilus assembly protein TadG-related protein [Kiritimatiellia bacterium]
MAAAPDRKAGQIVLVLAFMLLGLLFLVLVNADVFLAIRGKGRLQNAGDAAALAAARWQGITLNALGALNLAQVDVACRYADDPATATNLAAGIQHLQERLAFAGPLAGLYAAQVVAQKNGMRPDPGMTRLVDDAISGAARFVPATPGWPQKPQEYAEMLRGAVQGGVYAGCENARFYNYSADARHPLYNKSFYYAVDGEDWCWFFLRDEMMDLLQSFTGWGEVPPGDVASPQNPEFFAVDVRRVQAPLGDLDPAGDAARIRQHVLDAAKRNGCASVTDDAFDRSGVLTNAFAYAWYLYGGDWRPWHEMHIDGEDRLPLRGDVQPRFDVFGASAATRVTTTLSPFTPNVPDRANVWTAAAKPFGEIDGRTVTLDGEFPLVTPAFTAVRLIMLAGASEARLNMAEDAWVVHTRDHILGCAEGHFSDGCAYCATLRTWNDAAFRSRGVQWLSLNSAQCRRPTGGGPTSGGGTRHAR